MFRLWLTQLLPNWFFAVDFSVKWRFLVGSLLFPYVSQVYPPLDIDAMLVFFGLVFFAALALAIFLDRRARERKDIEVARHLFTGLLPIPFSNLRRTFSERQTRFTEQRPVSSQHRR